jgi:hypothetical protein
MLNPVIKQKAGENIVQKLVSTKARRQGVWSRAIFAGSRYTRLGTISPDLKVESTFVISHARPSGGIVSTAV